MAYVPISTIVPQFLDNQGDPLSGGTVEFYLAGTTTPTPVYADTSGTEAGTSIELNSAGRPDAGQIWLNTAIIYKLVLKDASGVTVWTADDISPPSSAADVPTDAVGTEETYADLRTRTNRDGAVQVLGRTSIGDGGGGTFIWVSGDQSANVSADPNEGAWVAPNAQPDGSLGAYQRLRTTARRVSHYATGGSGTEADPWTGWETLGFTADTAYIFPEGWYAADTFPNWALAGSSYIAEGAVHLQHTGAGVGVRLDGGAASYVFNVHMLGDFRIVANANTTSALYVRTTHHSTIQATALGASANAFEAISNVLSRFRLRVTGNDGTLSPVPVTGLRLDTIGSGNYNADCDFDVIVEGVSAWGVEFAPDSGAGNRFTGTSEGNGGGVYIAPGCDRNRFDNFWMEANGANGDLQIHGQGNVFDDAHALSTDITFNVQVITAVGTLFRGGFIRCANLQSTSSDTVFAGIAFSDHSALGIQGTGSHTTLGCYETDTSGARTGGLVNVLGENESTTAALVGSTTAGVNSYSSRTLFYQTVGGMVHFQLWLSLSAKDAAMAGNLSITGLPYPAAAGANQYIACAIADYSDITLPGGRTQLSGRIAPGASGITLLASGGGVAAALVTAADIGGSFNLVISGSYPRT